MKLEEAINVGVASRRQIHDLGYTNVDDAYERAAFTLAHAFLALKTQIEMISYQWEEIKNLTQSQ